MEGYNVDNEYLGMTRSHYFEIGAGPTGDPDYKEDYYAYLTGKWLDSTKVKYGGNGYSGPLTSSMPTRFVFPGSSDPQSWSTGGNTQSHWYDDTLQPGDRRAANISGPFTFQSGDTVTYDFAYVFTMDSTKDDSIIPETMTGATYRLYDMTGRALRRGRLQKGIANELTLTGLYRAVYFLEIESKKRRKVFQVVKGN